MLARVVRLLGAVLSVCTGAAQAASVTYYLNQSNEDAVLPDDVTSYLSVTITDGVTFGSDTGAVRFDVTMLAPLLSIAAPGSFGIMAFVFNTDLVVPESAIVGLPAGWGANVAPPPNQADGFGKFDIDVADTNNPQNATLSFYVSGVSGDTIANYYFLSFDVAGQGNTYFGAHVRGFADQDPAFCDVNKDLVDECAVTSAWFGGGSLTPIQPIPVPAAAWLFASALGALRLRHRRKSVSDTVSDTDLRGF